LLLLLLLRREEATSAFVVWALLLSEWTSRFSGIQVASESQASCLYTLLCRHQVICSQPAAEMSKYTFLCIWSDLNLTNRKTQIHDDCFEKRSRDFFACAPPCIVLVYRKVYRYSTNKRHVNKLRQSVESNESTSQNERVNKMAVVEMGNFNRSDPPWDALLGPVFEANSKPIVL
jgi:hypothetical protein